MIENINGSVLTSLSRGRFKALCGISPSGQGHDKCASAHKRTCTHAPSLCFYTQKSEPLVPPHFAKLPVYGWPGDKQRSCCTGSNPTTHHLKCGGTCIDPGTGKMKNGCAKKHKHNDMRSVSLACLCVCVCVFSISFPRDRNAQDTPGPALCQDFMHQSQFH